MDHGCYIKTDFIESVDFLRSPITLRSEIKKVPKSISTDSVSPLCSRQNSTKTFKGFCKQTENTRCYFVKETGVESSLLACRSPTQQVEEECTVFSYNNLLEERDKGRSEPQTKVLKDKPTIKVTVIPKPAHSIASSAPKKRKLVDANVQRFKKIQSISNHESISSTRYVLFVVEKGRKRDKIYKLKTAGSLELNRSTKNFVTEENTDLDQLSNLRLVLDSLNMEKKKEKGKKKKKKELPSTSKENEFRECFCVSPISGEISPPPSRVRITGQLGLNNSDEYVLKCNATVDGRPVKTESPLKDKYMIDQIVPDYHAVPTFRASPLFSNVHPTFSCSNCIANQKDSYQRGPNILDNRQQFDDSQSMYPCEQCKCVQVNMDIGFPSPGECSVRSSLNAVSQNEESEGESDDKAVKRSKSPLVVISVYPRTDRCENIRIVADPLDKNRIKIQSNIETSQNSRRKEINLKNRTLTSTSKSKINEVRSPRANSRKSSPNRETSKPMAHRINTEAKLGTSQNKTGVSKNKNIFGANTKKIFTKEDKSTNTNHNITKKKLVDQYTKKLSTFLYKDRAENGHQTQTIPSTVTIDIDGGEENYKLFFQQDCRTTDLKVRKTIKEPKVENRRRDKAPMNGVTSPVNNRIFPSEQNPCIAGHKSQFGKKTQGKLPISKNTSTGLKVRDSVELFHRREGKNYQSKVISQTPESSNKDKRNKQTPEKLAPTKHYRGDSCPIADPVKRDREIRALLGVNKSTPATSSQVTGDNSISQRNNLFGRKGEEERVMHLTESPCSCCKEYARYIFEKTKKKPITTKGNSSSNQIIPHAWSGAIADECECPSTHAYAYEKPTKLSSTQSNTSILSKRNNNEATGTQYEDNLAPKTSLYQQLILNRNVQIFLQIEQFTKQKPIVLTREQYEKVKRAIDLCLSRKHGKCICKTSLISVGEVRRKTHKKKSDKVPSHRSSRLVKNRPIYCSKKSVVSYYCKEGSGSAWLSQPPRILKPMTFSSTRVEADSECRTALTETHRKSFFSLKTLFKGRKRSGSPHLGTSDYSDKTYLMSNPEHKENKPFLKRLMSCLVMRSTQVCKPQNTPAPTSKIPSINSSIDSYHFSTSLWEPELTSSIYDTSASFYSRHSIYPMNNKIKRGFFNSVREFLTSRKT